MAEYRMLIEYCLWQLLKPSPHCLRFIEIYYIYVLDQPCHSLHILRQPGSFYCFSKQFLLLIPITCPQRESTQLLFAQAATGLTTHGLCEEHVIAIPPARSFQGFQKEPGPRDCFQLLATALLRGDGIAEGRAETVEHAGLQEKVLYWLWLRL